MSGFEGDPERCRLHQAGTVPILFAFNDPARFPELFRLEIRCDRGHLNPRGPG